ncbi:Uncharacterised protein [Mycobacterium tuberculosis]|nr:Uncharacterised protein [Mycobacterium tuberculosis]COY34227.1 Uncharacterised protein [Mycobacterium tuberculosis]
MRTGPIGRAGLGTRPASELTISTCGCNSFASARPSAVPPSNNTRVTVHTDRAVPPNIGSCR